MGRADSGWLDDWGPALRHLIRDIANPSASDPLYPQHRHKDWFVGHSWASGLFPSASGRNQV
jgi:endo-1,3(4)-beta-glucanase